MSIADTCIHDGMELKHITMNSDYKFTKNFIFLLNIDLVLSCLLGIINRTRYFKSRTSGLFKITIVMMAVYFFYEWIFKKKKLEIVRPFSHIFILFLYIGSIMGLLFNNFNSKFFSHLFEYSLPVLMMGFSRTIFDSLAHDKSLRLKLDKVIIFNSYLYIFCTILFKVMYKMGLMYWSAYTSSICTILAPYLFFVLGKSTLGFLLIAAGVVSGGRSVLIRSLMILAFYYYFSDRPLNKKIKETVLLIIGIILAIYLFNHTNYFDRIMLTINNLFGEEQNLNLATGGRYVEVERIVNMLKENPIAWITGYGFGIYQVTNSDSIRSFAHFMPLTYTMISGLIFSVSLYGAFLVRIIRLFQMRNSVSKMLVVYLLVVVIGSLFDASILTDYKFWLLVGFASCYSSQKRFTVELCQ